MALASHELASMLLHIIPCGTLGQDHVPRNEADGVPAERPEESALSTARRHLDLQEF